MGCKDKTTRRLEEYNDVFADIINVMVFDGERRVLEDDLTDVDTKSEFIADDKGLRSQDRDVAKFWTKQNIRIALFGLENQSVPDSVMPLRVYSYNGASYKAQIISDRKPKGTDAGQSQIAEEALMPKQPLYPVLTLVLYFGLSRWDTAKTLYDAVNIPVEMKPFIPNLPINLVEVAWLPDEVIDKFQSDFRLVARFFKQLRIYGRLYLERLDPDMTGRVDHILELMRMFSAYTGDPDYEALGIRQANNKEVTMLAAVKEYREKIENKGRREGRREGANNISLIYSNLFKAGREDDVRRAVQDPEYRKQIMAEFGYSDDEENETPEG